MDLEKLSKKELLELLKKKGISTTTEEETVEKEDFNEKEGCLFRAKNRKEACGAETCVEYGYCSKHKNTVQAKKARKEYEEKLKREEEEKRQTEHEEYAEQEEEEEEDNQEEEEELEEELSEEETNDEEEEESKTEIIRAAKNKWGNYEHGPTRFCFDINTKKVIGKQDHKNGRLRPLTEADKEVCDNYGMLYEDDEEDEDYF